jgi:predicted AlkP superfamily phosphohydrolase/phosphomutase
MRLFRRILIIITLSILLLSLSLLFTSECTPSYFEEENVTITKPAKLYWFIPDGVRAEEEVFNIYEWAEQGLLPNIKYLMDHGAYGYSIPTFPSHTPTNFATLLTGTLPEIHGIADGPMHIEGAPLDKPSVKGFASTARKVPAIWTLMEEQNKSVVLLSMPGSTPPELGEGITILGRWGGWGYENPALIFESSEKKDFAYKLGRGKKLFYLGSELTRFIDYSEPVNWTTNYSSFSEAKELAFEAYGGKFYGLLIDSTNDNKTNYDSLIISTDKTTENARISQGNWTDWISIKLKWGEQEYDSSVKVNVIKLDDNGLFRIRVLFDNFNKFLIDPAAAYSMVHDETGPMVDYVDNFPPQLIYEKEDRATFIEEANLSLNWHEKAVGVVYDVLDPQVFIHDIYTPNQMLTGRWWLGPFLDGDEQARDEVFWMYKKLDNIIGEALKHADNETLIVISSDHGAVRLKRQVHLNNYFASKGWLKFTMNNETGEPVIDWNATEVIFLKMDNIYINPAGLNGSWYRASGPDYEKLRNEVITALYELDDNGTNPVASVVRWEDAERFLDLPQDRVGDLLIANVAGYRWYEEMDENRTIFSTPLKTGYKQAVFSEETVGMWTPFIIMGSGVNQGKLPRPINHEDQLPIILEAMGFETPDYVQGNVVSECFNN